MGLLFFTLRQFVLARQLGRVVMEVDVFLPDGRIFIPDLTFVATERLPLFDPLDEKIHGAPDLVVEILSEDVARDRSHKFHLYYRNGIPWYWIVDPQTLLI